MSARDREIQITNDGATILKAIHLDNPAAKVLVGILFHSGVMKFPRFCFVVLNILKIFRRFKMMKLETAQQVYAFLLVNYCEKLRDLWL